VGLLGSKFTKCPPQQGSVALALLIGWLLMPKCELLMPTCVTFGCAQPVKYESMCFFFEWGIAGKANTTPPSEKPGGRTACFPAC
jgi:hypothetical protein